MADLPYWLSIPLPESLPGDGHPSANLEGDARSITVRLDRDQTQALLQQAALALRAAPEQFLLAALACGLNAWQGEQPCVIEREHHGRSDLPGLDVSRTLGWFTAAFPFALDLSPDPFTALRAVKERDQRLPQHGIGFGLLAAYHPDEIVREQLWQRANPPVSFNFLGQVGDAARADGSPELGETLAFEPRGFERDPQATRSRLLDVTAAVVAGRLEVTILYHPAVHTTAAIERLTTALSAALLAFCGPNGQAVSAPLIPADFCDVELSQEELANLLEEINVEGAD
jgi:non-ribosomal peptide synthase protein (TIGR01720 family)